MYYKMRKNGSLWGRFLVGGGTRKSGRRVGGGCGGRGETCRGAGLLFGWGGDLGVDGTERGSTETIRQEN